jgi:hypothetical protein
MLKIRVVGEIPEGAEESSVRVRYAPDTAENVLGQSGQGELVRSEEPEGDLVWKYLEPVADEEAEPLRSYLLEIERDYDRGELIGRYIPAEAEDTEGQDYIVRS